MAEVEDCYTGVIFTKLMFANVRIRDACVDRERNVLYR